MLYSYGRFLLPHLPPDRDAAIVQVGDEVALQYYRLERVFSSAIEVKEGEARYVKSPTEVGTGAAKDEPAPLSEIIEVLNERFGTQFTEEDRLFFQQIKEKACNSELIVRTALANPLDKFELGTRKLIEDLMIERMAENDQIVTRYMADMEFQASAFPGPGPGDIRRRSLAAQRHSQRGRCRRMRARAVAVCLAYTSGETISVSGCRWRGPGTPALRRVPCPNFGQRCRC